MRVNIKEMKIENVHMQALHRKLDVVLVQILPVQKPITAFARIRSQQDSALYPDVGFTLIPFSPSPHYFFCSATPAAVWM